jgi:hypothetical protein
MSEQQHPMQAAPASPLAVQMQMPAYLQQLVREDGAYWSDMGDLEPSDFGLNFLKIVQGTSKHAKPGWGPTGQETPLPQGVYFLDKSGVVIPEGTDFIPLLRSVTYIKFKSKNTRDGMDFLTKDRNDRRIRACRGLEWTEKDGERIPPLVTKFVNFYVATVYNLNEPAILSFHKTSTKLGQQLTRDIATATKGGKLPEYVCKFKLSKTAVEHDGGNDWYQLRYQPNGFIQEQSIAPLKRLYEMAQSFEQASRGVGVTEEGAVLTSDEDAPEPKRGTTTIIEVPSTAAQAPQALPVQPPAPAPQTIITPPAPQTIITPPAPQTIITPPAPQTIITPPAPQQQLATPVSQPLPAAVIAGW